MVMEEEEETGWGAGDNIGELFPGEFFAHKGDFSWKDRPLGLGMGWRTPSS